jgi:hypothetical protein
MKHVDMRNEFVHSATRTAAIAAIALLAACPVAVRSDDLPSYASGPPPETVTGTIYAINGRYTLTLEDVRGFEDSVTLHDGTIITPTGVTLGSGQGATITGHTDGKTFDADEIDIDPQTITNAQNVLPASDYYSLVDGVQFPGYAFGYNANAYGLAGYIGPYAQGYYGGYYGGGYYGGGYYGSGPNQSTPVKNPGGGGGTTPIAHRPVNVPPVNLPPGYRYPTGYRGVGPIVRGGQPHAYVSAPQYRAAPQPQYRAAPQFHAAPVAPAHPSR